MQAAPEPFLQAVAPSRDGLVVAVEGLCTWSWLAERCAHEGSPGVLGQARSMQAIPGGQANHDQSAAPPMAARLRGGLLPPASVSPAAMRAPREGVAERCADPAGHKSIAVDWALIT